MSIYPTHQNRHIYVVKGYNENVSEASGVGTIGAVKTIGVGNDKVIYFTYRGPGGMIKSDYIQLKNLDYVKLVKAWDMVRSLKKLKVSLKSGITPGNSDAVDDYVIRITLRNFKGMSDEDIYIKDAVVRPTAGMTNQQFYTALKDALNRSFSREVGATKESNPYLKFTADSSGLYIYELPQAWTLGIGKQERIFFEVMPTTIFYNGTDLEWGDVVDQTYPLYRENESTHELEPNIYVAPVVGTGTSSNPQYPEVPGIKVGYNSSSTGLPNGREIADLEWFCVGERGDQYRMVGWPDYIPTTYLVDPSLQYNVLEIHHAFTDTGVNSYRGEKDITIVAPNTAAGNVAMNAFIATLETPTGLTFDDLEPTS